MFCKDSSLKFLYLSKFGSHIIKSKSFWRSSSNISTAGGVATDILTGEADDSTLRSLRFITPTGNLPYLDPIWDNIMAADRK